MSKKNASKWLNKVAVVTGASAGVGRELAREFARQGACVMCAARREEKLQEKRAKLQAYLESFGWRALDAE